MSTPLFCFAVSLLFATTIADRTITILNNCIDSQYFHYVWEDDTLQLQLGSVQMGYGDTYEPNFLTGFVGYFWMNNENCNRYSATAGCTQNYGTIAYLQLYSETLPYPTGYTVDVQDSLGGLTNSMLIQSWPNTTDCSQVYPHTLEDGTVIGANTMEYCDNLSSYQVIICARDGN